MISGHLMYIYIQMQRFARRVDGGSLHVRVAHHGIHDFIQVDLGKVWHIINIHLYHPADASGDDIVIVSYSARPAYTPSAPTLYQSVSGYAIVHPFHTKAPAQEVYADGADFPSADAFPKKYCSI